MKMKIKTDYSYNFSNSVKDGLSRPLEFIFSKGRCEWDETGTLKTVNFDDKLNKSDQSKRLRTAIDSELSFSSDLMLQSFEKCMSIRNADQPNAKMMVIGKDKEPLKALLIDSWYDTYLGVMVLIRVNSGFLKKNMKIK